MGRQRPQATQVERVAWYSRGVKPCEHEDRLAVNPWDHPNAGRMVGCPPRSDTEPAWCRRCGALFCERPFALGWGWMHPLVDRNAATITNMARESASGGSG